MHEGRSAAVVVVSDGVEGPYPTDQRGVTAYLGGFVLLGTMLSLAGPALSHLRDRVGTDDRGIAWVFVGQSVGYIIGSVVGARPLDRGNGHRAWARVAGVAAAAPLALAASSSLLAVVASFAVLGVACGLTDTAGNTLVAWSRPAGSAPLMNALHLCFALGAVAAPLLVAGSLEVANSLWPVSVPAGLLAIVVAWRLSTSTAPTRVPGPATGPATASPEAAEQPMPGGRPTVPVGWVGAACVFFFLYVGLESGIGGWIHTYTERVEPTDPGAATWVNVSFWGGFALGRMAAIPLSRRWSVEQLLTVALGAAVAWAAAFATFAQRGWSLAGVTFALALAVAPQFAAMMTVVDQRVGLSGRVSSALVAASGLGGLVLPWTIGLLFDGLGPRSLPVTVLVAAVVTAIAAAVVVLSGRR